MQPQINAVAPGTPDAAEKHRPVGGLWTRPWVQNVLPLATSLGLHVVLIVLGIALFKAVADVATPVRQQAIIPETKSVILNKPPGGTLNPGGIGDPTRSSIQDMVKDVPDPSFDNVAKNKTNALITSGGGNASDEAGPFEGPLTASGKGDGVGTGKGRFNGASPGGGFAPWGGPPGGGAEGPGFLGVKPGGGNANRVIFLCDASGSMLSVMCCIERIVVG